MVVIEHEQFLIEHNLKYPDEQGTTSVDKSNTTTPNLTALTNLNSRLGDPVSIPVNSIHYLWWAKWHLDRFPLEDFIFSALIPFHQYYILTYSLLPNIYNFNF
jgi:hypothetical protein